MNFGVIINNLPFLFQGLIVTLKVAFISVFFSLVLGVLFGVIRHAKIIIFSRLIGVFIDITRSIPLILYIIFVHFSISPYLYNNNLFFSFFKIDSVEMFSAIIAITVFTSAYIAEIVRSGIESIQQTQILAAKSLALTKVQSIKYVILPQALKKVTPALIAQLVTLVKDTSLASAIGLVELTRASEIVYEINGHEFEILLFVACLYIVINFLIEASLKKINFNML